MNTNSNNTVILNSNNSGINLSQLNSPFIYDGFNTIDLPSANEFDACNLLIENDFVTLNSNIYDNGSNISLPDDLESLLINTTLSEEINNSNTSSQLTRSLGRGIQHDDTSDEQNVANNINPMFLFNKTGHKQPFNNIDTSTDFNNNPNENKFIKQTNKPSPILSEAPNTFSNRHQNTKGPNAFQQSSSYQQMQRKE